MGTVAKLEIAHSVSNMKVRLYTPRKELLRSSSGDLHQLAPLSVVAPKPVRPTFVHLLDY